jgi:hypothetical protein
VNPYIQSRLDEEADVKLLVTACVCAVAPLLLGYGAWHLGAWLLARPAAWWGDVAAIVGTGIGLVLIGLALEALERAGDRRRELRRVEREAPAVLLFPRVVASDRLHARGMNRHRTGASR